MCYGDEARPPAPPVQGPVGAHGDVVLTSADGTQFAAFEAHPDVPSSRAIVVLPDVRGLHHFYKDLALRYAEAGVHAIAIDYFGRTAGLTARDEDFSFREHLDQIDFAQVSADASAAFDALRGTAGVTSVFTVGFCLGGAMSWRQSASASGYAGNIGFYGIPSRVVDTVDDMRAPLLMLAAGQDFTPVAEVEAFAAQVRAHGVEADLKVYPDAPHSFFDRTFAEHEADCADAWRQMLAFIDKHAGCEPGSMDILALADYRERVARMYLSGADLDGFRAARDELFATHPQSAIPPPERAGFTGLRYFPANQDAIVTVPLRPADGELDIDSGGEDGAIRYRRVGILDTPWGSLTLWWIRAYGGGLFLPLRDGTCDPQPDGMRSYGGGRYLTDTVKGTFGRGLVIEADDRVRLDVNYAYNPSCAYDDRWACPLAPQENRVTEPIRAGELAYR